MIFVKIQRNLLIVSKKNLAEYEKFLNSLEIMTKLIIDKELYNIAKEEHKKFEEDENYNKYQIGDEFRQKLSEQFSEKDVGLIAIEDIKKIEELIPKIIIKLQIMIKKEELY